MDANRQLHCHRPLDACLRFRSAAYTPVPWRLNLGAVANWGHRDRLTWRGSLRHRSFERLPSRNPNLPLQYSVPGRLHRLFSALFFLGLPIACFVFARLFARWGERRWAIYSVITSIAFMVMFIVTSAGFAQVAGLVNYAGLFQRITLTIGWAWLTLLAVYMLKAPSEVPTTGRKLA
jgi:hypothetical protein